ncbi:MAG: hypothetical protein IJZ72_01995 [Oscillospiraceae bacterium]|nr:hypothetical protein [Oscillospiraceae bacterium]
MSIGTVKSNKSKWSLKRKQILCIILVIPSIVILMTGCQKIKQTFGKEYIMIDDYFEQLEADINYSFNNFYTENEIEPTENMNISVEMMIANLKVKKEEIKAGTVYANDIIDENNVTLSTEGYVEKALLEVRLQVKEELGEVGIELKSTELKRGLFDSIWHFVREHWIISLIIFGVISSLYELFENYIHKRIEKIEEKMENDNSENN